MPDAADPAGGQSPREELLTETETAALLHVSVRTLRRWRQQGSGPPAHKAGRRVLYAKGEVLAWLRREKGGP
jgi:excisionase family DNA binding protein